MRTRRAFTYDFESSCFVKPLEPMTPGAAEIAPGVFRLPEWKTLSTGETRPTTSSDLATLADWRGVAASPAEVKRRWQLYFHVRTMPGGARA